MILIAFFLGLLVLVSMAAAGRHLFYLFWWGVSPRVADRDIGDVACGWFMGAFAASAMLVVGLMALAIGSVILSLTCGAPPTIVEPDLHTDPPCISDPSPHFCLDSDAVINGGQGHR